MSTLKLENIGHPDAAGNALELGADGSIVSRGSVSKYGAIVTNARGDGIVTRSTAEGTPTNWVSYHHGLDFNGHNITSGAVSARGDYMSMSSNWYIEDSAGQERFKTSGYPATNYFQSNGGHFFQRSTATPVADTAPNMVTSMVISNQGHVSTPYQPAFFAYNQNTYTFPSTGSLTFTSSNVGLTALTNVGNHFDASTGRFTAPVGGNYFFMLSCSAAYSSGYLYLYIKKNNSSFNGGYRNFGQSNDYTENTLNVVLNLQPGDYITAATENNYSGGTIYGPSFCGYLIG